jgi:hypothetical protein
MHPPHGNGLLSLYIDRHARLREAKRLAFYRLYRWLKSREGWGHTIDCHHDRPLTPFRIVDPVHGREEGCQLIQDYHICREAYEANERTIRAARRVDAGDGGRRGDLLDGSTEFHTDDDLSRDVPQVRLQPSPDRRTTGGAIHPRGPWGATSGDHP